jgi:hypothetical protein
MACNILAGEFRQLNLNDAWKDDVLQLHAQLYYASQSLQRPLEDSRSAFGEPEVANPQANLALSNPSSEIPGGTRKRKHKEDGDGGQNPRRWLKCLRCNNKERSFFEHGFRSHL